MDETQMTGQNENTNSEQEFEYIELDDGQKLPKGYEYEYIEVPSDDVSEMDVVNRPHAFSDIDDEDDMASVSEISATLRASQQEEMRNEAPFPSFLQAGYDDGQVNVSDVAEEQNINEQITPEHEEPMVNVADVEVSNQDELITQNVNQSGEWQAQSGSVNPVNEASSENIHFLNMPEDNQNWQEDTRASYNLEDINFDDEGLQFQKNEISSINVNDYIEPEATYKATDVAVTEIPDYEPRPKARMTVQDVAENVLEPQTIAENVEAAPVENISVETAPVEEEPLDILATDEKEFSLDELLQEDNSSDNVSNEISFDDLSENIAQEQTIPAEQTDVDAFQNDTEESQDVEYLQTADKVSLIPEPETESVEYDVPQENVATEEISEAPVEEIVEVPVEEVVPSTEDDSSNFLQPEETQDVQDDFALTEIQPVDEASDFLEEAPSIADENVAETVPVYAENNEFENEPETELDLHSEENTEQGFTEETSANVAETASAFAAVAEASENIVEQDASHSNIAENIAEPKEQPVFVGSEDEVEQINPQPVMFDVADYTQEDIAQAELHARIVSKQNGVQSFKADDEVSDILLTEVDFSQHELNAWNLILYQQNIIPLQQKVAELSLPQKPNVHRYVSVVQGGNKKFDLCNEENLKIINASHACVAVQGRFICGDFEANSGVIVNDFMPISLTDFEGKKISFKTPASGLLTGPNGCVLFFFGVRNLWVPNTEVAEVDAQKLQYKISKWYSGTLNDKYFEFSAQSESSEFIGNEEMNSIHVNVNNSSYGWNVTFDDGLSMNLRDLREYQTRFGKIPSANGTISYGQKTLKFQNVERIVVYEAAQYFFYN